MINMANFQYTPEQFCLEEEYGNLKQRPIMIKTYEQ